MPNDFVHIVLGIVIGFPLGYGIRGLTEGLEKILNGRRAA